GRLYVEARQRLPVQPAVVLPDRTGLGEIRGARTAEFAYEPETAVVLATGESVQELSGKSPWRLAGRRLLRNRIALASLILFILIVAVSFGAPLYAQHIANTDPFASNITGKTVVGGKSVDVLQQGGGTLGIGVIPIGPTWQSNYFLGADSQGRDVAARVLYGGRASLEIRIGSAPICCAVAGVPALSARCFWECGTSPPACSTAAARRSRSASAPRSSAVRSRSSSRCSPGSSGNGSTRSSRG